MVNSIQLNPGADLYAELKGYAGDLNKGDTLNAYPDVTLAVTLSQGNYTLSNRLEFRCNVIIRGGGATVTATNHLNLGDDCLFAVRGDSAAKLKLEVYDATFNATFKNTPSETDGENKSNDNEMHYFKIMYADRVIFRNSNILLQNGSVTCIDLRRCSNIEVTGCTLQNYNECNTSGVLWIRGETSNVVISNNFIRKHGNDEALAIWGDGNISSDSVDTITKRDIQIIGNTFEYGYDKCSKYPIDKYIALFDGNTRQIKKDDGSTVIEIETRPYYWYNVVISNNRFTLKDLVKNLIYVSFEAGNTEAKNIFIENNTITHSGYSVKTGEFERDFAVVSQSINDIHVTIKNNTITPTHTVYSASNYYVNLLVNGAKVDYAGNRIDATGMPRTTDDKGTSIGIIVAEIVGKGGKLLIRDNNLSGLYMLGRCYSADKAGQLESVELNVFGNHLEGDNRVWCKPNHVAVMTANYFENEFVADKSLLLFQNFGMKGSFSVCNNVWTKSSLYSGNAKVYYKDNDIANPTFERIVFVGNQFTGQMSNMIGSLPAATTKIVGGNMFY